MPSLCAGDECAPYEISVGYFTAIKVGQKIAIVVWRGDLVDGDAFCRRGSQNERASFGPVVTSQRSRAEEPAPGVGDVERPMVVPEDDDFAGDTTVEALEVDW